jgi:hypothetical protein
VCLAGAGIDVARRAGAAAPSLLAASSAMVVAGCRFGRPPLDEGRGLARPKGVDMHYMLLIYAAENEWEEASPAERAAIMEEHDRLERDLRGSGRYGGCGALASGATATTLRRRAGKLTVTDGPFAETREQLGGYYLVEADDLDQAIAFAERIPGTPATAVEVRPLADVRFRDQT